MGMKTWKGRLAAAGLAVLVAAQAMTITGTTAQAGTVADTWVTYEKNPDYRVLPLATGLWQAEDELAYMLPSTSVYRLDQTYSYDDARLVTNAMAAQVDAEDSLVQAWIAANIQNIVPDGSNYYTAIADIVAWMSASLSAIDEHTTDRSYFGAYHAFADAQGNSITYACAFNSLVHALPFDENGLVNYTAGTNHLQTTMLSNTNRSWSGVYAGNSWLYYDVEWYANGHGTKDNTRFISGSTDPTFAHAVHWIKR